MQRVLAVINRFLREDAAQDLTEYGLLAALIACFAIGALGFFGQMLQNTFWQQVVNLAQNI
jgi:Flp pilus assembly pilin Flp